MIEFVIDWSKAGLIHRILLRDWSLQLLPCLWFCGKEVMPLRHPSLERNRKVHLPKHSMTTFNHILLLMWLRKTFPFSYRNLNTYWFSNVDFGFTRRHLAGFVAIWASTNSDNSVIWRMVIGAAVCLGTWAIVYHLCAHCHPVTMLQRRNTAVVFWYRCLIISSSCCT